MKKFCLSFSILLTACIIGVTTIHAQQKFKAVLSPTGQAYFSFSQSTFELDLSQKGEILSFSSLITNDIDYDFTGRIDSIGGSKIKWDYKNRLSSVGDISFEYDFENRLIRIGEINLEYDFQSDKISSIKNNAVHYDFLTGKIDQIGEAIIKYNFKGNVIAIDDKQKITVLRTFNLSNR